MPHLSPTTLTTDEQRLILRATAGGDRIFEAYGRPGGHPHEPEELLAHATERDRA